MRAQEVIVGDPERDAVACAIFCAISAGNAVGLPERAVQAFDELFERTELFRDLIIVCQSDDLSDKKIPVLFQLELLGRQGISAVAVRNELQCPAGELFKFGKSDAQGKDKGADIPGGGDLIAEDRAGNFIHDEPDISFDAADLDISLISDKLVGGLVIIGIHEWADDDRGRFRIVIDHCVGDIDPMDLFHGLDGLSEGELEIYPVREAKSHDVGIIFLIFERGCPFWQLV